MPTRTGSFPIGLRRGWSAWQKDLPGLCAWAKGAGFDVIDLGRATAEDVRTVIDAGLRVGSVDLLHMGEIASPDAGKRRDVVAANVAYVAEAATLGCRTFFTVVGGEAGRKRAENYRAAVEAFAPIAAAADQAGAKIAVEGYPGGPPHLALLATSPETVRAMLTDIPRGLAINYDPSHLIRLGVDHCRFLREFARHVVHVHGKDTELFPEAAYELGLYQPSAFHAPHGFGEHVWRYALPGHGVARWTEIFKTLVATGYKGAVCVELEDENFNGTEAGEKAGLTQSLCHLQGA